ncbi:ATP-binding cassette domain-containing protein [Alphaproteobacteria bacterium HT1-32]|nr:ATP-binding cassette domain-containing protein [Alphaproteobacteria bacterium HT1-32]
MTGTPLLEITDVSKRFGGLSALDGVNLSLETGKLHAIIGPNGAGKTTFFNVITGTLPVSGGRIKFLGDDITDRPVHQISRRGLARTLQIKSVFGNMTVRENLWIAAQSRDGVFSIFRDWRKCTRAREKADSICEQLNLTALADQLAANLSYGDVALLEIGLALATEPKLLLLDEPICGMGPAETEQTVEKIQEISKHTDIIIIEHDIEVVFRIADQITVMANGKVLAQGTPEEIAVNPDVRTAYLGDDDDD